MGLSGNFFYLVTLDQFEFLTPKYMVKLFGGYVLTSLHDVACNFSTQIVRKYLCEHQKDHSEQKHDVPLLKEKNQIRLLKNPVPQQLAAPR